MANVLKYKTSQPTKRALRKGNVVLGIGEENYGPSSTTGYYSGIDVPEGGFVVYTIGLNNNPKAFVAETENDLVDIARTLGGGVLSVADSKTYLAGLNNTWILDNIPNNVVTDGLVLDLNVSNISSYPESGTTVYDLSGNGNNGTLVNSPTFNKENGGTIELATNQAINLGNDSLELSSPEGTISIWFKTNSTSTSQEIFYTKENRDRVIYIYDNGSGYTYNAGAFNGTTGDYRLLDSGVGVTLNWVNVTFTYIQNNGSNAVYKMYLNGVEKDSDTTSITTDVGSDNYSQIGGSVFGGSNGNYPPVGEFQGSVSHFLNYNRALSPSEILQNYYQSPIVTDGLVFALDAGNLVSYESGSTTAYSMTGSFTGSLNNGVGYLIDNGGVWEFDGTDDIIAFEPLYNLLSDLNYCTLEVWCDDYGYVRGSYNTAIGTRIGKDMSIARDNNSTRIMILVNTAPTGNLNWNTGVNFTVNGWQHLVAVFDEGVLSFYKDGILISSNSSRSGETLNASTIYLMGLGGDSGNGDRDWNGKIGIGRVYNKALTADEVAQNFNAQKARFGL